MINWYALLILSSPIGGDIVAVADYEVNVSVLAGFGDSGGRQHAYTPHNRIE